ncbi:MAG: preprotein translocase subunit SecA, partial [Bacillota bacterium]|nr:preprotein translocase subunit SecA [Bacillota bacterium]
MGKNIFEKMFGTYSDRELKRIYPILEQVNALQDEYRGYSNVQLRAKTDEFKERYKNGESLDDILPEAYATVREASDRALGMRHFDVQIIGGIILHQGRIAEMKTGEGKTLVATLPAYLNGLTGEGVHIVTVNDYLAKRDSEWMGKVYKFLGLSVGLVLNGTENLERQEAYAADITYATNNEIGFDYLRDNMVMYKDRMVQRGQMFAIVDEVDSILIDEARTPLIISGMGSESSEMYTVADRFVRRLKPYKQSKVDLREDVDDIDADYIIDEKGHNATLTKAGLEKAEAQFNADLSDPENLALMHHINNALKANGCMTRDVDYVVKDGQVLIVDEFTGRIMIGRRYSEGLHQAIEAKENVKVERESKTLATITFQNYFRLYKKLSGMTGTARTEETEFQEIYALDVVEIPTNMPLLRNDLEDVLYKTETAKFNAVLEKIKVCYAKNQPVLVGTISIEKSERLSKLLKMHGIEHQVLNAKHHDKEALIVAQAGKPCAVTIATNMAGRGTDIILGGNAELLSKSEMAKQGFSEELIVEATGFAETDNEEILNARKTYRELYEKHKAEIAAAHQQVIESGGLCIIGTERHESRRIDNQLRGRAGRQGDPGETKFFLSLEDDLMRLFGSEKVQSMLETLKLPDDEPIENGMLTGAIEKAQKRVEARNFEIRKNVLRYDEVMNEHRKFIYGERQRVLNGEDIHPSIMKMIDELCESIVEHYSNGSQYSEEWNVEGLISGTLGWLYAKDELQLDEAKLKSLDKQALADIFKEKANAIYEAKEAEVGPEIMREFERNVMLRNVDLKWMDHIDMMDQL